MNKYSLTTVVAALLVFPLSVCPQTSVSRSGAPERAGGSDSRPAVSTARASAEAAGELLRKRVETVEWEDTPFEDVIDWLKDEGAKRVNVVPRWGALSVEGVDTDTLVTLQLNNTTVAEVLNEVMDQLSEEGVLRYRAIGNTLRISTKADFDRKLYVRVYDVTDILFNVPNFGRSAPNIDLQNTNSGGGGSGGGGGSSGQSIFQGGSSSSSGGQQSGQQAQREAEERLQQLKTVIERTIAPESWDTESTGGAGTIEIYNLSLIIRNTIEVHEMIAGFFSFGE